MAERERILAVDDEESIRQLIALFLEEAGYACVSAADAGEARRVLASGDVALVLCDVNMPGESGLELARQVTAEYPETAVVMVTGVDDPALARTASEIGASGYVLKPFTSNVLAISVTNALHRRRLELENRRHRERLAEIVLERTADLRAAVARLEESERALRQSHEETIRRLALAVELRDGATGAHIERMGELCARIAARLGLGPERCALIRLASPLHDVGKIAIPDRILSKAEELDADEWALIRTHAEIGHRMLAGSGQELLELAAVIALTHHERLDGSGYPRGLRGDDIPVEGRIAAVGDVFDALTSERVYQRARPPHEALAILEAGRGTQFDPAVLNALHAILEEDARLGHDRGLEPAAAKGSGLGGRIPSATPTRGRG
jgi:putative two-component system response regulator